MKKVPLYRQIADRIKEQIFAGVYQPEAPLPTEAQLQVEYNASRVTVRHAIKLLVDEGILESIQGSGTYVRRKKVPYGIDQLASLGEKLTHLDLESHSSVLAFEITLPTAELAQALNIEMTDRIYNIKRVRFIGSTPAALEHTWMPLAMFPDLTFEVMQGSKYRYIEEDKQLIIDYSEQEIVPVLPSAESVEHLHLLPEEPILKKITRSFLNDGTVFELSHNYFKPADYRFTLISRRLPRHLSSKP